MSANPVVIYALDIVDEGFQVRWFSDNLQAMTGWTAEQSHGAAWWTDNIHPDDRPRVLAARPTSLEREHSIEKSGSAVRTAPSSGCATSGGS